MIPLPPFPSSKGGSPRNLGAFYSLLNWSPSLTSHAALKHHRGLKHVHARDAKPLGLTLSAIHVELLLSGSRFDPDVFWFGRGTAGQDKKTNQVAHRFLPLVN